MDTWKIAAAIVCVPVGAFVVYLIGRMVGLGWSKSWFEAKRQDEERRKQEKEQGGTTK